MKPTPVPSCISCLNFTIRVGFYLILSVIPDKLSAQAFTPNPDWRFENFNGQNHFISREISDLTIDKHGYVWTSSLGVQRFDGYKTIDFNSFDQARTGLRTNYSDLIADNDGRVWVNSAGLCYYDDESAKFIYVQADTKHPIKSLTAFFVQKNYLWFVSDYGLTKLDVRSKKISFTALTNVTDALVTRSLDDSTLLVSSREKVYIYNIKKNSYSTNTLTYNHSLVKIFSIIKKDNDVFLGTNIGFFSFKNLKEVFPLNKETNDIGVVDMIFLPADKEKKYLFLATEGKGLMVYNTVLKKIEFTYIHADNNIYSLPNNLISKLYSDKTGRLWIGSFLGISMLDVANQQLKMRFLGNSDIGDLGINKIARDKSDSAKVWMSSYNRGMICVNWKTKEVEKIFNADPATQKIYDFAQVSKNKWLLATAKEIIEWNPRSGILSRKKLPVPDSLGLLFNIRRLILADDNTCFITTNRGLFKYNLLNHQVSIASIYDKSNRTEDPLKYILLSGFCDAGKLWAASRNGLFSYDLASGETRIYGGNKELSGYYFFDVANANNLIVCASGSGVSIFNKHTKQFQIISSVANLFKPSCGMVISVNKVLWIGSEAGILNYDLKTNRSAKAENESSMTPIFPSSPFTVINKDIVFGFRNGFAYFTPEQKNNLVPSDPVIENVNVNNQPVLQHYTSEMNKRELVLSHSNNSINIAFTAFLYTDPTRINFRYRLEGADHIWQYTVDQRSAHYAQLEPGEYTFYVQSGNKNGDWNKKLSSFSFIINPPYWETWWFRILVILVIATVLYQLYRYRIKNILAIQNIREKIASDFHDDIGSALSSISIFSEVADKQLKEQLPSEETREIVGHIASQSRAMLDAMDDIIWAVNPQNDHFNDLAVRMHEFAVPLLEARNIQFDINIDEGILSTHIKMEARKNIFMIFKECINNTLKHSGCSEMSVAVNKLNNQFELTISDNGRGFDVNAPNNRNGLKNMQKRACEINGTIQVTTNQGEGTVTRLLVNII